MTTDRIIYYENVLELKASSPLQRSDVNNWLLCRTCLTSDAEKFTKICVMGLDGLFLDVAKMLTETTGLQISTTDQLPQMICRQCLNKLSTFYFFRKQVKRAGTLLNRMLLKLHCSEYESVAEAEPADAPPNAVDFINILELNAERENTYENETASDCDIEVSIIEYIGLDDEERNNADLCTPSDTITFNVETIPLEESNADELVESAPFLQVSKEHNQIAIKTRKRIKEFTPFLCGTCDLIFERSSEFALHCQLAHPHEIAYKCIDCHSTFAHRQSLKRHSALHSNTRSRHVCSVCDKAFTRSDDWKRHMRVHTNERPYSCPMCSKAFKQVNELNEHKLTHTRMDFPCDICGHRLKSRNGLYLHKKGHAGIKNYVCNYCKADGKDKRFMTNGELRSHCRMHQQHQQQQITKQQQQQQKVIVATSQHQNQLPSRFV